MRPCSSPARAAPARSSSRAPSTRAARARDKRVRRRQLRRHPRDPARERALRPRARRVHRRGRRPARAASAGADGGTLFLDEIGELPLAPAGQAAARAAGAARSARSAATTQRRRRRARRRRDQPRPRAARSRSGTVPRGPLLSPQRHRASTCRRCASGREDIPLLIRALPAPVLRRGTARRVERLLGRAPMRMLLQHTLSRQHPRARERRRARDRALRRRHGPRGASAATTCSVSRAKPPAAGARSAPRSARHRAELRRRPARRPRADGGGRDALPSGTARNGALASSPSARGAAARRGRSARSRRALSPVRKGHPAAGTRPGRWREEAGRDAPRHQLPVAAPPPAEVRPRCARRGVMPHIAPVHLQREPGHWRPRPALPAAVAYRCAGPARHPRRAAGCTARADALGRALARPGVGFPRRAARRARPARPRRVAPPAQVRALGRCGVPSRPRARSEASPLGDGRRVRLSYAASSGLNVRDASRNAATSLRCGRVASRLSGPATQRRR